MIVTVMGVTGSGKTTVGLLLAKRLGWEFADADDFHSAANKDKMHHGIPLTDADRIPWLAAIHDYLALADLGASKHRAGLFRAQAELPGATFSEGWTRGFVYLKGSYELIDQRLQQRKGHFADEHILAAQFADLQEPADAVVVDISGEPEQIVDEICRRLQSTGRSLAINSRCEAPISDWRAVRIVSRVIPPVSGRCFRHIRVRYFAKP